MKRQILWPMLAVVALIFLAGGAGAASQDTKPDRPTVYKVPTPGKIVDVEYRPEFDEWWVKCREDGAIAVYSYDHKAKKWGKVLFVPEKPQPIPQRAEKDVRLEKPQVKPPDATPQPKKKQKEGDKAKPAGDGEETIPDEVKPPETKKDEPPQKEEKAGTKKWWNPLEILKKGEKLIRSPISPSPKKERGRPAEKALEY